MRALRRSGGSRVLAAAGPTANGFEVVSGGLEVAGSTPVSGASPEVSSDLEVSSGLEGSRGVEVSSGLGVAGSTPADEPSSRDCAGRHASRSKTR